MYITAYLSLNEGSHVRCVYASVTTCVRECVCLSASVSVYVSVCPFVCLLVFLFRNQKPGFFRAVLAATRKLRSCWRSIGNKPG